MSYKTVRFCAGGGINKTVKEFSTSSVQQRLKESRKSLKVRFRQLLKDYKQLFKRGGEDVSDLEKLFKKDLILLLSEAVNEVQTSGGTLNRVLGLTQSVPDARSISNRINIVVKKAGKYYAKTGYLSKALQIEFNDLFDKLIESIVSSVVNDKVVDEDVEDDVQTTEEFSKTKNFSSTRLVLFASEDQIEVVMNSIDLDDLPVVDVEKDRILLMGNNIPDVFKGKFSKFTSRCKSFNSDMKVITVHVDDSQGIQSGNLVSEIIESLKVNGFINTQKEINHDVEQRAGYTKYVFYLDNSEFFKSDESKGVYLGKIDLENPVLYSIGEDIPEEFIKVFTLIDEGLGTANLLKVEKLLKSIDKAKLAEALIRKYGSNPLDNLM